LHSSGGLTEAPPDNGVLKGLLHHMTSEKVGAVKLIRDFFAPVKMDEMKDLTAKDRAELGSAIAKGKGLTQEECSFEFVNY